MAQKHDQVLVRAVVLISIPVEGQEGGVLAANLEASLAKSRDIRDLLSKGHNYTLESVSTELLSVTDANVRLSTAHAYFSEGRYRGRERRGK